MMEKYPDKDKLANPSQEEQEILTIVADPITYKYEEEIACTKKGTTRV